MVGKLLEGYERPLVDGQKQWSRGVKVLYGESAEKQERVAEELGVEVDVEEDDYCCEGSPWENSLFEWWRWRTQEVLKTIASK